jgi:hypothetical protein
MKAWVHRLLPFILYAALVVASFYPQSFHPTDTVAYVGDSLESVYLVAWNVHQFFRNPWHLFDANILYPAKGTLALTDHRLLPSLLVAPVVWMTGNPVLAYNVAVGLGSLLAAAAARRLGTRLGLDPVGAWAAGALYAFHTYQINEAPRLHIIFHAFIPLALDQLLVFLKTGSRRAAAGTAFFMLLQGLSANYHLLYGSFLLGLVVVVSSVLFPRLTLQRLPVLLAAGGVAAVGFAPIAAGYLRAARAPGYFRELPPGIDLQHYLSTTPTNLLYGAIGTKVRLQQQGPHFIGFLALALAVIAVLDRRGRRPGEPETLLPSRLWVPAAAGLALVLLALSLGREARVYGHLVGPGPYRLLYDFVPGFQLVRIPERLSLLVMLFVALLAGRTLTRLRAYGMNVAAVLLAALVPLEHLSPLPHQDLIRVGADVPAVYRWLAAQPVHALAEVPIHGDRLVRKETLEMYFSTYHWKPIIHGYTGYPPPRTEVLRTAADALPFDLAALSQLRSDGVDTLVVHRPPANVLALYSEIPGRLRPALAARFELERLELYTGFRRWEAEGRLIRLATFRGEEARIRGGEDVAYRIAGP